MAVIGPAGDAGASASGDAAWADSGGGLALAGAWRGGAGALGAASDGGVGLASAPAAAGAAA